MDYQNMTREALIAALAELRAGRSDETGATASPEDGSSIPAVLPPQTNGNTSTIRPDETLSGAEDQSFYELFEKSPFIYFSLNSAGIIRFLNEFGANQLGFSAAGLVGESIEKVILTEDRKIFWKQSARCILKVQETIQFELRFVHQNGSIIFVEVSGRAISDPAGTISLLLVCQNITSQRFIQDALKKSTERIGLLFQQAPIAVIDWDLNGAITEWNPEAEKIFGYTRQEAVGQLLELLVADPDDPLSGGQEQVPLPETAAPQTVIKTNLAKGGKKISCEWHITRLKDDAGKIIGAAAFVMEVTRREAFKLTQHCVDHAPESVSWLDKEGRFIYVNEITCRSLKYSKEELLSMRIHDIDPQFPESAWPADWKMLKQLGFLTLESERRTSGGRQFPVEVTLSYLAYQHQEYCCMFVRDITDRHRALKKMNESQEKWRSLVENTADTITVVDSAFKIQFSNSLAAGNKSDRVVGTSILEHQFPEYHEVVKAAILKVFKTAEPGQFENKIQDPTGQIRWYTNRLGPIKSEQRVSGVAIISTDITERKAAEETLRSSEERYRLLAMHSTDMISKQLPDGTFTFVSPASTALMGHPPERLVGRRVIDYIHPDDVDEARMFYRKTLQDKSVNTITFRAFRKDGYFVWIESSIRALVNFRSGIVEETLAVSRDITERKTAEAELRQHRAQLEELIGERTQKLRRANRYLEAEIKERIITEVELKSSREALRKLSAHLESAREEERTRIAREIHDELGQVLSALKMDVNWLERHFASDDSEMFQKTESMSQLIKETIGKVKKISQELRPSVLDNLGFVAAVRWQAREFEKRAGIQCRLIVESETVELPQESSVALFRIFQEALTNIFRHAQATQVTVQLQPNDSQFWMVIRDNGVGIKPEQMNNSGSFGLLGIRERIHNLKGEVDIEGKPNKGTKILVKIPLKKEGEVFHD